MAENDDRSAREVRNLHVRVDQIEAKLNRLAGLWNTTKDRNTEACNRALSAHAVVNLLLGLGALERDQAGSVCASQRLLNLLSLDLSDHFTQAGGLRRSTAQAKSSEKKSP